MKIFLIFTLLFIVKSFANDDYCAEVYRTFFGDQIINVHSETKVDEFHRSYLIQKIREWNLFLKRAELEHGGDIFNIYVGEGFELEKGFGYMKEDNPLLVVPHSFGIFADSFFRKPLDKRRKIAKQKFYSLHPRSYDIVYSHEYGHAILDANFARDLNWIETVHENAQLVDEMNIEKKNKLSEEIEEINIQLDFQTRAGQESREEEIENLNKRKALLSEEIESIEEEVTLEIIRRNGFDPSSGSFAAYHELFADAFSLLSNNGKPEEFESSFYTQHEKTWFKKNNLSFVFQDRSFSYKKNALHRWKETTNIYGMFSPVRFHLNDRFLKMPYYRRNEKRAELLRVLYESIVLELRAYKKRNFEEYTPYRLNRRLINIINRKTKGWP